MKDVVSSHSMNISLKYQTQLSNYLCLFSRSFGLHSFIMTELLLEHIFKTMCPSSFFQRISSSGGAVGGIVRELIKTVYNIIAIVLP